jgi:pyruvate kinase
MNHPLAAPPAAGTRRTKIVCTIGPATQERAQLLALARAGMDVARLNFSHGSHAWHTERFRLLRGIEAELERPLSVLLDLPGPKLRIGDLPPEGLSLQANECCFFSAEPFAPGPPPRIPLPVPPLLAALCPGHHLFLDDGQIEVAIVERRGDALAGEVRHGGLLRGRKGISAPAVPFEIPSLGERDLRDLALGLQLGVDWVAVSFVRRAEDLAPVRDAAARAGVEVQLIAKIEQPEAVEGIDAILAAADALMVARGDLGVEMPLHQVPVIQKELIRRSVRQGKPVITATQMLESMTASPRPTRAEVSDVANAILDGTSAVMLSAETAIGRYPVETVATMGAIAAFTEESLDYRRLLQEALPQPALHMTDAVCQAVVQLADDLPAAAILCATTSGQTARMVARMRPRAPVIGATASDRTYHRLPLVWGVRPLLVPPSATTDEELHTAVAAARAAGWLRPGDRVVATLGIPVGTPGRTSRIQVLEV